MSAFIHMKTYLLAGLCLLLAACESLNQGDSPPPKRHPADMLCMSDCLGTGGNRDFCTDRCTR